MMQPSEGRGATPLTGAQQLMLAVLRAHAARTGRADVRYEREWVGHLQGPVASTVWVGGTDVSSRELADDWEHADLEALVGAGALVKLSEWQDPNDEYGYEATYRVVPVAGHPATPAEVRARLAGDRDASVRRAVAGNPPR